LFVLASGIHLSPLRGESIGVLSDTVLEFERRSKTGYARSAAGEGVLLGF
jgi:hypothetical protein